MTRSYLHNLLKLPFLILLSAKKVGMIILTYVIRLLWRLHEIMHIKHLKQPWKHWSFHWMLLDMNRSIYGAFYGTKFNKEGWRCTFSPQILKAFTTWNAVPKKWNLCGEGWICSWIKQDTVNPAPRGCFLANVHAFLLFHVKPVILAVSRWRATTPWARGNPLPGLELSLFRVENGK